MGSFASGLEKLLELVEKIFSEEGYSGESYRIKATFPMELVLDKNDDGSIELTFKGNLPTAKYFQKIRKREIGMTVDFLGIILSGNKGWIKLDNFPDIPFKVED